MGIGIAIAVATLVVASRLDRGGEPKERRIAAPIDVVPPEALRDEERAGRAVGGEQAIAELERGAWVQVVDERGRLAQQYRAERVEPLPDRWMSLERPRAQFFQSDGRVVTLAADAGRARVPRRALETGSLAGNVEIRIHPAVPGGIAASLAAPPLLVVETDDARFDNVLGEIRCDGPVRVRSDAGSFDGVGLSMLVDPEAGVLERLVVDRATAPIRLDPTRREREQPNASVDPAPPAAERQSSDPRPAERQETGAPRFYRLVLERDVVVTRLREGRRTTISGDRLVAVFSMGGAVGDGPLRPRRGAAPIGPAAAVASLAFAAGADEPPPESIEIAYAGRLVLEPASEAERLASADDRSIEILADRPDAVTIVDASTESTVRCAKASFVEGEDLVEAFGWDDAPLTLASPRLAAEGGHFRLQRALGRGGFIGPGRLRLAAGGELLAELAPRGVDEATVDPSTGALRLERTAGDADPKAVAIEWSEGLELRFRASDGDRIDGALRSARFVGDVAARGEGFEVRSSTLEARFSELDADEEDTPPLERIVAQGAQGAQGDGSELARARRTGEAQPGRLAARTIDLALTTDAAGRAVPIRLDATGVVEAEDATQSLFGDRLAVVFLPRDGSTGADPDAVEIATAQAEGDLQILVRGERAGASSVRAYASRLDGDAGRGLLVLRSDEGEADGVRIVRDALVADRLGTIELREAERAATASGGGRVRTFAATVGDERPMRVEFPILPERPALLAEWRDGFRFVDAPRAGVDGELELTGAVRVRSTPDRSATDALDADTLLLALARDPSGGEDPRGGVRSMLARGGAVVESRAWTDESRSGDPRLFRLAGEELFYDLATREGFVEGAGSLLAHVPEGTRDGSSGAAAASRDGAAAEAERIDGPMSGLAAEGTTRFRWSRRLDLTHVEGDRYQVDMQGDVEVGHVGTGRGGAGGEAFAMTAGRLVAGLLRTLEGGSERGADLGGTATVESIEARSDDARRVFIRTGDVDLECDSFSYSLATRVAILTAAPGRSVVVVTRDRPQPVRAERVEWNLETGRIAIEGATGRVGR